jgi:hypothetical protein
MVSEPTLSPFLADNIDPAASLIRPFSLLSLPFFRRKATPPSDDALTTIRCASAYVEPGDSIDHETAVKAVKALQILVSRFKTANTPQPTDLEAQVEILLEAYLRVYYITARAVIGGIWNAEMAVASRQSLLGYLEAQPKVTEEAEEIWRPHLLGAIFPPSVDSYLLNPLFDRPRRLVDEIQHHHLQRPGGKKVLRDSVGESSLMNPVKEHEAEALHHIATLRLFLSRIADMGPLPLPTRLDSSSKVSKAKLKLMEEEDKCRPRRIALESCIVQCELATALASVDVPNMKIRARGKSRSPTPELLSDEGSSVDSEEELDVKPDIRSSTAQSPEADCDDGSGIGDGEVRAETSVVWDEMAEGTLDDLLEYARKSLDDRHSAVLTATPQRLDWLGTTPITNPSNSPEPKSVVSECEDDSDFESESEPDSDLDPSSDQAGATPLRTVFRLQDRYEELRLAVWLSLPPDSRGKMSAYMRGAPTQPQMLRIKGPDMGGAKFKEMMNGRIGEAWDRLGMALLKKFDR